MSHPLNGCCVLCCLLIFSCDIPPNEKSNQTIETQTIDHSTSQNALDYAGVYNGKIPCADCEGIKIKLVINDNKTYQKYSVYLGKSTDTLSEKGEFSWNATGTSIYLTAENGGKQGYVVRENALVVLDQEGNIIRGELEDLYILTKTINKF